MRFLEAIPQYPVVGLWLGIILFIAIGTIFESRSKRKNRD